MRQNILPRLALVASACIASTAVLADPPKTDGLWRGDAGAAFSAQSGNTTASALLLHGDVAALTEIDKISLGGNYNYGRSKVNGVSTTTSDKWNGYGEYDYNLSPSLFTFGKVGFEGDKIANLSLRSSLGAGLGYKVINTKETQFNLYAGVGYSTDKYSVNQTVGNRTSETFSRASVFLAEESSHVLSSSTTFKQRLELTPGVSGDKAMLTKFTAGLAVAMSSTLSLSVGIVDTNNSKPPAGLKSNDLGIFTGINVKLGAN
ncbi:MAG: DUF481 domain-containing protein [Burkholderiales bacterium]|nr:DUF481 domain-containing protein [Burkholderiales bacterium]